MSIQTDLNFDLELRRDGEQYVAAVLSSPGGQGYHEFELPFTDAELSESLRLSFPHARHLFIADHEEEASASTAESTATPRGLGERLFATVFEGEVLNCFNQSRLLAKNAGSALRVRLRFGEKVPELAALPWEYLYAPAPIDDFLALHNETPLVRFIPLDQSTQSLQVEPPLTILAVVSNPQDVPPLAVEQEWVRLQTALAPLCDDGQVRLERLEKPTLSSLRDYLRCSNVHVLHFIGHGYFDAEAEVEEGGLVLEDEKGRALRISADALKKELRGDKSLRLIFLNACEGARSGQVNFFAGTAQQLVQDGIPSVVAMQFEISDDAALILAREFYEAVADGYPIDTALSEARREVRSLGNESEWATPILFSRLDDNGLVAVNPIQNVLGEMIEKEGVEFKTKNGFLPLPIDVVHVRGHQTLHTLERMEANLTAASDLFKAVQTAFQHTHRPRIDDAPEEAPRIVILQGTHGTGKTTQLKRMVLRTARQEFEATRSPNILPIYVDLKSHTLLRTTGMDALVLLMQQHLENYWSDLTRDHVLRLLERRQLKLRIFFDHISSLSDWERVEIYEQIRQMMEQYPCNDYLIAVIPGEVAHSTFADVDKEILNIQPLAPRKVRHFLLSLDEGGQHLLERLNETQLFDLAATPWILVNLVQLSQRGRIPQSRTHTMERLLRETLNGIPVSQGMRAHASDFLLRLAWKMQYARASVWPVSDAFAIMSEVRGNRGYDLEEFYDKLVEARLLKQEGGEKLSFAQVQMQAYCSAKALAQMADRQRILEDIIATLGRSTRLRWWRNAVVLFSGLLAKANAREELDQLMADLIYGVNLLQSEQTFLAARCLIECKQHGYRGGGFKDQVVEALVWRLHNTNEPDAAKRARAARFIGQFGDPALAHYLLNVAYRQTRRDRHGNFDFDLSSVRIAAAISLLRMKPSDRRETLHSVSPVLADLFEQWQVRDVDNLIAMLGSDDVGLQGLAAMALGEVYGQLKTTGKDQDARELEAQKAFGALHEHLLAAETAEATRWSIAHAFTYLDDAEVYGPIIAPFLATAMLQEGEPPPGELSLYKCMVYLIGRLRLQEIDAHGYLIGCLQQTTNLRLWSVAIEALGWLADPIYKEMLEEIAIGNFADLLGNKNLSEENAEEYLQNKAIRALATVGDDNTLERLREYLYHQQERTIDWRSSLKLAYYETSEAIYWRLQRRSGAAVR